MNVPVTPKSMFLLGCKSSEIPWSRFGTKSAQNDVSTISFCIKKTCFRNHGFSWFCYVYSAVSTLWDWKKAPMDLLCRGSTWVQHFVVVMCRPPTQEKTSMPPPADGPSGAEQPDAAMKGPAATCHRQIHLEIIPKTTKRQERNQIHKQKSIPF